MPHVLARAKERLAAYTGPRFFPCKSWYFVQATVGAAWTDLAEIELPAPALR
jgi:hypothetical protein